MSKTTNPVRGYIRCPVCQESSTVHQVGEGKLLESGEPPKNGRNVGLYYYRCPECGNSSMSKTVSEFIGANKVDDVTQLPAKETSSSTTEPVAQFEPEPEDNEPDTTLTEASPIVEEPTVRQIEIELPYKKWLAVLGGVVLLLWLLMRLKVKQPTEPTPVATQEGVYGQP